MTEFFLKEEKVKAVQFLGTPESAEEIRRFVNGDTVEIKYHDKQVIFSIFEHVIFELNQMDWIYRRDNGKCCFCSDSVFKAEYKEYHLKIGDVIKICSDTIPKCNLGDMMRVVGVSYMKNCCTMYTLVCIHRETQTVCVSEEQLRGNYKEEE